MRALLIFMLLTASLGAWTQDQVLVRLNHGGVVELMRMALQYNQRSENRAGFKIPAGAYSFKVKREDLAKNPIIAILSQISDVNFNRDFPFHVTNSDISVQGKIDEASLRTAVSNYTARGFDLRVSLTVDEVRLSVADISLCETKRGTRCGPGLSASFKDSSVALRRGSKIIVSGDFRVSFEADKARLTLVRATSNLDKGPRLDISIGQVVVPPIAIIINGQETQLDTSGIRTELMGRREFLAQKLLDFAGEFIASDLAEMVNKALKNQCLPTRLRLIELGREDLPATGGGFTSVSVAQRGRVPYVGDHKEAPSFMELLQRDLAQIIKSASFDVTLKNIRTPLERDLEIRVDGALRMNRRSWGIPRTVGNSPRALSVLNIDQVIDRRDHLAVVISEPVFNGALNLLSDLRVFQQVIDAQKKINGIYYESVKLHLRSGLTPATDRLYLVLNMGVRLRETDADGVWAWIKRTLAVWLERNNNNSILYFPIQFEAVPQLVREGAGHKLRIRITTPFASETALRNDFGYPSNITAATDIVRKAVLEELKGALGGFVNREFDVPLDAFLAQNGISFTPKSIRFLDSSYLMVTADFQKLDLKALTSEQNDGSRCQ